MDPVLYLAPLRGFTDVVFREAFTACFSGFDLAVAPFISTMTGRSFKVSDIRKVLSEDDGGLPVIPQILGNDPDDFIFLARHLYDLGYPEINWNLGCPYAMVAKKKRGSGLLPYPDRIDAFLDRVFADYPGKLSIKMRLGRHDASEILELLPILDRYPLTEIIIHPRTGVQMYNGATDLSAFEGCIPLTYHRLVFNGDINSLDDFRRLSARLTGVRRWMIGRGAVANPFLPMIIKAGCDREGGKTETFMRFHDALYEGYGRILEGPSHITSRMKGFWSYFSGSFKEGDRIFKKIRKTKSEERYLGVVADFFDGDPEWIA